jgi:phosphoribosylformylglycinamidine (FGAM) synthase PurS component
VTKYRQKDNEAVIKVTNDIEVRTTHPTKRYIKCWQFKIDAHNAEKAEEFVRDITFSFIKNAANRQADDAGRILYIISY